MVSHRPARRRGDLCGRRQYRRVDHRESRLPAARVLNGTAGHTLHKITEFSYPWTDDALLLVHTDGLVSRWDLDRYPGLVQRHPSLVAGVLFRDFNRGRDDVTVVAARGRAA